MTLQQRIEKKDDSGSSAKPTQVKTVPVSPIIPPEQKSLIATLAQNEKLPPKVPLRPEGSNG